MIKLFCTLFISLIFFVTFSPALAQNSSSFVSVVNPVRGEDFWDSANDPKDAVLGEMEILKSSNVSASWLIRFDAFKNSQIINILKPSDQEKGLFLEITPTWTKAAGVEYRQSPSWHFAGSVFLTGYNPDERKKLIDTAFTEFKNTFGFYPQSVGAWWIDGYSLDYMQSKYGVTGALIVADQYTTDNYQIWGQYWSAPYYPSKKNTLTPAQDINNKIPVVVMQWAARDPVNGYGGGVQESTYSLQANDYLDYHNLTEDYFSKLIDVFTKQPLNSVNHVVVGLENSYSWTKYKDEYQKQIEVLAKKRQEGQLTLSTMKDFAGWYQNKFPAISPEHIIVAHDPLGSDKITVWFMNPYYRAGWFYDKNGSVFRDVRQYIDSQEEPCYKSACIQLNFATFPTRVLDDITYGSKTILDEGKLKDIIVKNENGNYMLRYKNEAGNIREIAFMTRDIAVNGKVSSIDGFILDSLNISSKNEKYQLDSGKAPGLGHSLLELSFQLSKFLLFVLAGLLVPGFLLVLSLKQKSFSLNIFLSICTGFVGLTLAALIAGYLNSWWLMFIYLLISMGIFVITKSYKGLNFSLDIFGSIYQWIPAIILILLGTTFQVVGLVRSGWMYDFGIGFWGPTGHDGIWHQALINQLINHVPPQNPALSGETLLNYHYFFDLLVAATYRLTQISVLDLLYRFYPILFSLLLGLGSYLLSMRLFKNKIVSLVTLYFVYFSGSFGWIVEYLKSKQLGGESAFWVNQPVSMNLNPPFAISLVLVIAIVLIIQHMGQKKSFFSVLLLILLVGSLAEFKVYAGVLVLGALALVSIQEMILYKKYSFLQVTLGALLLTALIFLPQNSGSSSLLVFSPYWFIHSMIDFPDRVGWLKLSQARQAYFARGEWFKFLYVETLSLIIFVIGNLGARFLAILALGKLIKKRYWYYPEYIFILGILFFAFMIPLIFIQKGNNWNTIQFFYYFLYFVALFSGATLIWLYKFFVNLRLRLFKILGLGILGLLLLITPLSAIGTFRGYLYPIPPTRVSLNELDGLNFLKGLPEGVVLTYPYNSKLRVKFPEPFPLFAYDTSSYVAAFSGKSTFVEDEIQQEILQNDYKKRLVAATDFFQGRDVSWSRNFLLENRIKYIYLPKFFNVALDYEKLNLREVYTNKEVLIYQVSTI